MPKHSQTHPLSNEDPVMKRSLTSLSFAIFMVTFSASVRAAEDTTDLCEQPAHKLEALKTELETAQNDTELVRLREQGPENLSAKELSVLTLGITKEIDLITNVMDAHIVYAECLAKDIINITDDLILNIERKR